MHDIVFLWSHPRSVSTAMERIMHERGDMITFHEPFIYLYYVHDAKRELLHFERDPNHPTSYEGIKGAILNAAECKPVFVKDMCYYVADYIHRDPDFVKRVKNTFLIRAPEKSIPSYYRLDQEVTLEEIGLETQYRHFELARETTGELPVVIEADDLQRDTEATMRAYCRAVGIEFMPDSLTWDEPVPPEWMYVAGWHGDLSQSKGIEHGQKDQAQKPDLDSAPRLRAYCAHHLPYYQKMREFKLNP